MEVVSSLYEGEIESEVTENKAPQDLEKAGQKAEEQREYSCRLQVGCWYGGGATQI